MLSSSRLKIHEYASPACPPRPWIGDSARKCETRGGLPNVVSTAYHPLTVRPVVYVCPFADSGSGLIRPSPS